MENACASTSSLVSFPKSPTKTPDGTSVTLRRCVGLLGPKPSPVGSGEPTCRLCVPARVCRCDRGGLLAKGGLGGHFLERPRHGSRPQASRRETDRPNSCLPPGQGGDEGSEGGCGGEGGAGREWGRGWEWRWEWGERERDRGGGGGRSPCPVTVRLVTLGSSALRLPSCLLPGGGGGGGGGWSL